MEKNYTLRSSTICTLQQGESISYKDMEHTAQTGKKINFYTSVLKPQDMRPGEAGINGRTTTKEILKK